MCWCFKRICRRNGGKVSPDFARVCICEEDTSARERITSQGQQRIASPEKIGKELANDDTCLEEDHNRGACQIGHTTSREEFPPLSGKNLQEIALQQTGAAPHVEDGNFIVDLRRNAMAERWGFVWDAKVMEKWHIRVVEKVTPSSVLSDWNLAHPNHEVRPGDHLIKVNGKSGRMETLTKELSRLHIVCEFRPADGREVAPDAEPPPALSVVAAPQTVDPPVGHQEPDERVTSREEKVKVARFDMEAAQEDARDAEPPPAIAAVAASQTADPPVAHQEPDERVKSREEKVEVARFDMEAAQEVARDAEPPPTILVVEAPQTVDPPIAHQEPDERVKSREEKAEALPVAALSQADTATWGEGAKTSASEIAAAPEVDRSLVPLAVAKASVNQEVDLLHAIDYKADPGNYIVELHRSATHIRWGFVWRQIDMDKRQVRVLDKVSPSCAPSVVWNTTHGAPWDMRPGDMLVKVNGKGGSLEVMGIELRRTQIVCEFLPYEPRELPSPFPQSASRSSCRTSSSELERGNSLEGRQLRRSVHPAATVSPPVWPESPIDSGDSVSHPSCASQGCSTSSSSTGLMSCPTARASTATATCGSSVATHSTSGPPPIAPSLQLAQPTWRQGASVVRLTRLTPLGNAISGTNFAQEASCSSTKPCDATVTP